MGADRAGGGAVSRCPAGEGRRLFRSWLALEPVIGYLRGWASCRRSRCAGRSPVEELIERYRRYLLVERALTAGSAKLYVGAVRPFVERFERADRLELSG